MKGMPRFSRREKGLAGGVLEYREVLEEYKFIL